ncbi:glycosyltransferase [Carnobacterium sp.]|uniref:glycosyltransferase n=1 Tax=Carnobacterium sp. TaxID=48221 RepID=UPI00388FB2AE
MTSKVLHIMSGFGGGISSFIWNKAIAMDKEKIIFDIMTYDDCNFEFENDIANMGGKIFKIPNPKIVGWKPFYKAVNEVMSHSEMYEMVHSHIPGYRAIPFRLIAKKNGIKRFIIHAHTSSNPLIPEKSIEKLNRKLNGLLATDKVSCGIKSSNYVFGEKYVKEKRIMHIPNSIDETLYFHNNQNGLMKETFFDTTSTDTIIIGHVGRFHEVKNHAFMIQIMLQLKELNIDFLWLFIGAGDLQEKVEKEIKKNNLQNNVKFLGRRNDVYKFYNLMDVFVLPSFYEGFPTVAVEAQAAGTPAILSESITKEADLGMGLVNFYPINEESTSSWIESIVKAKTIEIPTIKERKDKIEWKKFSNSSSAKLYEEFIFQKIKHYEI